MTLGGLALAIGVLVDESTVAVENIHSHLARGEPVGVAVFEATRETITPRLLAMLAILAVFVPSFFWSAYRSRSSRRLRRWRFRHARATFLQHAVPAVWLLRHQHITTTSRSSTARSGDMEIC